jgi:hypothetical protein
LIANNQKPNFAYQVKLAGDPINYVTANENIGFVGRWWREEWVAGAWSGGQNSSDSDYISNAADPDSGSPTGLKYKFTGYLLFDYFLTDSKGNASLEFDVNSSFHVLFKISQRAPRAADGEVKTRRFKVNTKSSPAYGVNLGWAAVGVYGQIERPPVGGKYPAAGLYDCQFILTEETFHGSGGTYAGNWAAAMGAQISFEITD